MLLDTHKLYIERTYDAAHIRCADLAGIATRDDSARVTILRHVQRSLYAVTANREKTEDFLRSGEWTREHTMRRTTVDSSGQILRRGR